MSSAGPTPPPGWYPNPNDAASQRYWDGGTWTDHTAPNAAPPPGAAQTAAPQPLTAAAGPAGAFAAKPSAWAGLSKSTKAGLIGGAVVVLILVSSISAALNGGREAEPAGAVGAATATPTAAAPPARTSTPEPAPPAPVIVDAGAFTSQANSHLDDMSKDLDDMVVTISEDGFFRLISNSVELSFNLGQLQGLDVPANVAQAYTSALTGIETSIDSMDDEIANQDNAALLAIIDTMRAQIAEMHNTVNTAA